MENGVYTWSSADKSLRTFENGLNAILSQPICALIILSCSANRYEVSDLDKILGTIKVPLCGGSYPNVFLENELLDTGVVFIGLPFSITTEHFCNIENNSEKLTSLIQKNSVLMRATNALMFYDGLMENTEPFIEELHYSLDYNLTILGGGAGDLDFVQRPCVYTNNGIRAGVIQLVVLPETLSVGIGHGWEVLEGPFLVSESSDSVIHSLNYQAAFDVYQESVEKVSDYKFSACDFFDIAKHFPFGIESIQGDLLVRDPIVINQKSIQCVGNVPINSMVYILKGEEEKLIKSAEKATLAAKSSSAYAMTIVFDCISRKLYLEDAFDKELNLFTSNEKGKHTFGVLSLGEIVNDSGGSIRLLNKSTVIGCL